MCYELRHKQDFCDGKQRETASQYTSIYRYLCQVPEAEEAKGDETQVNRRILKYLLIYMITIIFKCRLPLKNSLRLVCLSVALAACLNEREGGDRDAVDGN